MFHMVMAKNLMLVPGNLRTVDILYKKPKLPQYVQTCLQSLKWPYSYSRTPVSRQLSRVGVAKLYLGKKSV